MEIKIFVTGGTIDNIGYDSPDKAPEDPKTLIPKALKQARATVDCSVDVLMMKDSRWMTEKDREFILKKCRGCKEDRIVITHGTDTMAETARILGKHIVDKTIVLLGAFIPYVQKDSDALFNLGVAIAAVQSMPRGVYIAMNGKIFSWDNVRKNEELAVFEDKRIRKKKSCGARERKNARPK